MQKEKFKVINFIRELLVNIDKNLDNFPKKDIEIKNRIRNISYDLLENVYIANAIENVANKTELLNKCIAQIKVMDFLINLSYDKQIINNKKYFSINSIFNLSSYFFCFLAASTNPTNKGAGLCGLDFNSGWNCDAIKYGCSFISTISTKFPSG